MKRIGTLTAAVGLIYLGVWIILSKSYPQYGDKMFRLWPILFVFLGLEIIFGYSSKNAIKPGLSLIIIPIILIFLVINMFKVSVPEITISFPWIDSGEIVSKVDRWNKYFNDDDLIAVDFSKSIESFGSTVEIDGDNLKVIYYKSTTKDIKIIGKVYVDRSIEGYQVREFKKAYGYLIEMNEPYINRAYLEVYLPEGINGVVRGSNLDVKNNDEMKNTQFEVFGSNTNAKFKNAGNVSVDSDLLNIDIESCSSASVLSKNIDCDINGDTPIIKIKAANGDLNIKNDKTDKCDIDINQGTIKYKTPCDNVKVDININQGVINLDGEKTTNSSLSKTYGRGENEIKIKVNQGAVNFSNRE